MTQPQSPWQKIKAENKLAADAEAFAFANKRFWPLLSFALGFSFDALTLTRIDRPLDYLRLLLFITLLFALLPLTRMIRAQRIQNPKLLRHANKYPLAIQFLFGSLFSAHAIYYFQSASFSKNIIFAFLLIGMTLGVEFLENRLGNLYLQCTLLYLVTASYFAFFFPILFQKLSFALYISAMLLALTMIWGLLFFLYRQGLLPHPKEFWKLLALPGVLCGGLIWLYSANLIPPVPLALKYKAIYHKVEKRGNDYFFYYQKTPWWIFWKDHSDWFDFAPQDQIIAFTPVFAPTGLQTPIQHLWLLYDEKLGDWRLMDRITMMIQGGRDEGFRGFTRKNNLTSGEWRLEVRAEAGQLLGTLDFKVRQVQKADYELAVDKF